MKLFLDNARRILDTAVNGAQAGLKPETMTILVLEDGSLRAVSGSDWALAALAEECGARMSYRVDSRGGRVSVEGIMGAKRCVLESEMRGFPCHSSLRSPNFSIR